VRGGIHAGDPGSVMPRRDAPANSADPDPTGPGKPGPVHALHQWRAVP